MIKKIVICMVAILILGIGLYTAGSKMDDNKNEITNVSKEEKSIKVEEFSNIDISSVDADVEISIGKDYSVKYNFDDQESIKNMEVNNNTLFIESDSEDLKIMYFTSEKDNRNKINITIPENKLLNSLKIDTVGGDISLKNIKYTSCNLDTTDGDVSALNTFGNEIKMDTVDGDCIYTGIANKNVYISSVEGDIKVDGKNYSIEANSSENIYYNSQKYQYEFIKNSKGPKMIIENVSGDIEIEDK
ncbi:hypothetical protein EXD82_04420 [Peptacetobacter hominis]|uniref:DUF4097 domain-containing protein n=1 Tax=Peptacetobacter hominis TaxID=2743610 RepID=A0A544QW01_9FIRM|nr:DUF4097 family beta strand repeat-containing protein [Peptacetobacter hominis]TQQ84873.1 hypothetical protein EXD82_04420 [Peptacetobacter hominis]